MKKNMVNDDPTEVLDEEVEKEQKARKDNPIQDAIISIEEEEEGELEF